MKRSLSKELEARGFIYQSSNDNLAEVLDGENRTVYLGIDPTADSIHVGNLVPYMLLNHMQRAGHKVILLMGGGTALIGDPGGKSTERPFVEIDVVAQQCIKMEEGVRKFVGEDVQFVNNYDWLSKLSMIEYLRDVGKHFTVNAMVKKDIVANRLDSENPISYTEFSYSLLQAYDYLHLHREFGCDVQIGGSDQWSNIIAGIELIRKTTGKEVFAFTNPIITDKATGKKFGKSEGNAIWLNADKTSPFAFYQFWLNTSDESVIDYLKIFTFLSLEEISEIEIDWQKDPGNRHAQKVLAESVTQFVHGIEVTKASINAATALFAGGSLKGLSDSELAMLLESAPSHATSGGSTIVDILVDCDLAASKREARTFIESGAVSIDGVKIDSVEAIIDGETGSSYLLKRGKKNLSIITLE